MGNRNSNSSKLRQFSNAGRNEVNSLVSWTQADFKNIDGNRSRAHEILWKISSGPGNLINDHLELSWVYGYYVMGDSRVGIFTTKFCVRNPQQNEAYLLKDIIEHLVKRHYNDDILESSSSMAEVVATAYYPRTESLIHTQ
ncbi:hypothetical protein Tco_0005928 [Tanacetum coccineum]